MQGGEYFNWIDSLPPSVRADLLSQSHLQYFKSGTTIYERRGKPAGVLRLERGRVRMFMLKSTGTEFLLKICEKGETIGDLASVDGLSYPIFAEAMTDITVMFIPISHVSQMRAVHPEIDRALVSQLASTARGMITLLERVTMHTIEKQVAGRLQWLLRSERIRGSQSNRIRVSQSDLALMIGASRQTVNKALSRLEESGFLTREYGTIFISNEKEMDAYLSFKYH